MRYIKTYENFEFKLETGDYILINSEHGDEELSNYLNNNIAQVCWGNDFNKEYINVNYKVTPSDYLIKKFFNNRNEYEIKYNLYPRAISQHQIVSASEDKENLKQMVLNKKYNL